MSIDVVAVTGGSGRIGRAVIHGLNEHGYRTVNLDRQPGTGTADEYRRTDLLDAGEVYGALARSRADAVVHLGTIPSPEHHPGFVTFRSNVMTSYHVLEAATALGLEAACLASSINAMGSVYQDQPMDVAYLPVDEAHPLTPRDPYALGKQVTEVMADGFGRLAAEPRTISTIRFPWVAREAELRDQFVDGARDLDGLRGTPGDAGRDALFAYLHVEDAARVVRRVIEADLTGHEPFWAVAEDTSADVPSATLVEAFYPDAEVRAELPGNDALIDCGKARRLLGWEPDRSWRAL